MSILLSPNIMNNTKGVNKKAFMSIENGQSQSSLAESLPSPSLRLPQLTQPTEDEPPSTIAGRELHKHRRVRGGNLLRYYSSLDQTVGHVHGAIWCSLISPPRCPQARLPFSTLHSVEPRSPWLHPNKWTMKADVSSIQQFNSRVSRRMVNGAR